MSLPTKRRSHKKQTNHRAKQKKQNRKPSCMGQGKKVKARCKHAFVPQAWSWLLFGASLPLPIASSNASPSCSQLPKMEGETGAESVFSFCLCLFFPFRPLAMQQPGEHHAMVLTAEDAESVSEPAAHQPPQQAQQQQQQQASKQAFSFCAQCSATVLIMLGVRHEHAECSAVSQQSIILTSASTREHFLHKCSPTVMNKHTPTFSTVHPQQTHDNLLLSSTSSTSNGERED